MEAVKAKAKTRWYYNRFPKPVVAGFTLAELLLTLTILGVVVSLTVPSLIQSEQQAYFNSGVWNAYTMLSQTVETIQANNGIVHVGPLGDGIGNTFRNDFCSVLSCIRMDVVQNIWGSTNYSDYKGSNTTNWTQNSPSSPAAILNNGVFLWFYSYASCSPSNTQNVGSSVNACGYINVDINGAQGPNMLGEDAYAFWISLSNGIYSIIPMGASNDGYSCSGGHNWWTSAPGCTYQRLFNLNSMP